MKYYLCKFLPPPADFLATMTDDERDLMKRLGTTAAATPRKPLQWYRKHLNMEFVLAIAEDRVPSTKAPDPYMQLLKDAGGGNILAFFEIPNSPPMGRDPNTPEWVQHIAGEALTARVRAGGNENALMISPRAEPRAQDARTVPTACPRPMRTAPSRSQ